jgi:hypothetical protein
MPHDQHRVAPFGNPRIIVCLPLPEAYRSLPRPSSPSGAKASIVCPYTFDQKNWSSQQSCTALCYAIVKDQNGSKEPLKMFTHVE